jgi:signal transduction histidine kinase
MGIKLLSYLPAIIGILSIGAFVLSNNPKSARNKLFALANLAIALWLSCLLVADITDSSLVALISLRLGLFFGAAMVLAFYLFAIVFPYKSKVNSVHLLFYSLPLFIVAFLSLTPWVVPTVSLQEFGAQPHNVGYLYSLSDIVTIAYVVVGAIILLIKHRSSNNQQKSQIKFILLGLAVAAVVNIFTGLVLTFTETDTDYIFLGGFSLFIFSVSVGYAIIRHGFLDIRLIVARSFAYLLLITALSTSYGVIIFGVTGLFFDRSSAGVGIELLYLFTALVMVFTFQPLRKFFDRVSIKLFYQDAYDPQDFLKQFNGALVADLDAASIINKSSQMLSQTFKPSFISFYLAETPHVPQSFVDNGSHRPLLRKIRSIRELTATLSSKVILADDIADQRDMHNLYDFLREHNVSILVRLANTNDRKQEDIGYAFIGHKKSGSLYGKQDLKVLEIVANELVIAIQNALRFQEIENFNATLEEKIEDATRQLRRTNERLRLLDQTKDDFISMSSHQLRTPLTSIKGYVSMVLDGDAGRLTPLQRKLLTQAFVSSQRMVYLISDLLNVSRLRTGKFVIEPTRSNLANIVKGEVEQLVETAKSRNLELTYSKPEHFPTLMVDETKLRQVIMNFIDNAIYYTPSGGRITVNLVEKPQTIEFTVADTGMGVPKRDHPHLFTKFFRAHNAKRARPDGTGLGLFMAKKVIIAQGGAVVFQSREGKGSTFGFTFPKDKLQVPPAKEPVKSA